MKSLTLFRERKENLEAGEGQEQLVFLENLDPMDPVDLLAEPDLQDHLESLVLVAKEVKWVLHSKDSREKRVIKVHLEQLEVEQERSARTLEKKIFTLDQKETEAIRDKKVRSEKKEYPVLLVLRDSMEKRDKKASKEKSDLLVHRVLKLENQVPQDWMDSMAKRENQDFVVTPEGMVSKEARVNLDKVDSPELLENLELMETPVQLAQEVAQETLVKMAPLDFLDYQV